MLACYRKNFNRKQFANFTLYEPEVISLLIVILRLSILINILRLDDEALRFQRQTNKESIHPVFADNWLAENPVIAKDLQVESEILQANDLALTFA